MSLNRAVIISLNTLILALTIFVGWNLYSRRTPPPVRTSVTPLLRVGSRVLLPSLSLVPGVRYVLLVAESSCTACERNLPFYRSMLKAMQGAPRVDYRVVTTEAKARLGTWLGEDFAPSAIRQIPSGNALGVFATPTLLLLDPEHVVTDLFVGEASEPDQRRILARILTPTESSPVDNQVAAAEIFERDIPSEAMILDIRDRLSFAQTHRDRAVNIPDDELASRAQVELPLQGQLLVDCSIGNLPQCRTAAARLKTLGFPTVTVLLPSR